MKHKKIIGIVMATILSISGLTACSSSENQKSKENSDTIKEQRVGPKGEKLAQEQVFNGLQLSVITFDVNKVSDGESGTILGATQEGLFRANIVNGKEELEPAGCESWEVSENQKVYTFHLRKNKWNDGTEVIAKHYVDSIVRALTKENACSYAFFGFDILNGKKFYNGEVGVEQLGVKAFDDYTLEVTLEEPTPYFLSKLSYTIFYPIRLDVIEQIGDSYGTDYEKIPCNGPFLIESYVNQQSTVLVKNPNYWDKEHVYLEKVNLMAVPEFATQAQLFESKQLDHTGATKDYLKKWREEAKAGKFQMITREDPVVGYFGFNQGNNGPSGLMGNAKIRKAIGYAVNREEFLQTVYERLTPAYGFIPTSITCGDKPYREQVEEPIKREVEEYRNHPEKLQALFHEGLKELGKDVDDLSKITLQYVSYEGSSVIREIDEYFKQAIEKTLGVKVDVRIEGDFGLFYSAIDAMEYDFAQFVWAADYNDPMTFVDVFQSDSSNNHCFYKSEKYDALLDKLSGEKDQDKRLKLYQQLEELLLVEDAVISPIYYGDKNTFVHNNVKGLQLPMFGATMEYKRIYKVEE